MAAQSNGFEIDGGRLVSADLLVWAAGVKAPDFMNNRAGMETTPSNQVVTKATLRSTHDDNILALGDCASLTLMDHERPLPPTAQIATQQAEHLARHLPAWLAGEPLPDFKFRDYRLARFAQRLWRIWHSREFWLLSRWLHTRTLRANEPCDALSAPSAGASWFRKGSTDVERRTDQ